MYLMKPINYSNLSRLTNDIEPTHLFARNIDVDIYNNEKLDEMNTRAKVYIAKKKNKGPKKKPEDQWSCETLT